MSSRASKSKQARARLQSAKNRRLMEGSSALDDVLADDDVNGNVYDVVDEDTYQELVETRRQREDFVVDDDGLGYHDDGEERLGDEGNTASGDNASSAASNKKKRASSANATLTAGALKKARQSAAAARKSAAGGAGLETKTSSMWNFVNQGPSIAGRGGGGGPTTTFRGANTSTSRGKVDVDALLEQLDAPPTRRNAASSMTTKRRSSTSVVRGRRGSSLTRGAGPRRSMTPRAVPRSATRHRPEAATPMYHNNNNADDDDQGFASNPWDDGDDDDARDAAHDGAAANGDDDNQPTSYPSSAKKVRFSSDDDAAAARDSAKKVEDDSAEPQVPFSEDEANKMQVDKEAEDDAPEKVSQPRRRLGLARPKLGKLSAPAQRALEQEEEAKKGKANRKPDAVAPPAAPTASAAGRLAAVNLPYSGDPIASADAAAASSTAGQADLESVLCHGDQEEDGGQRDTYVDMFWTDMAEKNGDILLFGKVPADGGTSRDKEEQGLPEKFISACAVVSGNVRNLFVLPRPDADMLEVHREIGTLLHDKGVLPKRAGSSWAGKVVKRNYAFGDEGLPREETDYLKVVYESKFGVPDETICKEGGTHFARILGAGASTKELFILKRKLMGPCWIRLRQPAASRAPISWCKVEMTVDDPKRVVRWDLLQKQGTPPRPPPPVVTVTLKLKTVVHPKTHASEIVSVSALCHKRVQLETATRDEASTQHMQELSLIRPLPAEGGARAQFPRDMDQAVAKGMPTLRQMPNERALISRLLAQVGMWDPDVIVGHHAWGYDMEVLLKRCVDLKLRTTWSKMGRRRRCDLPQKGQVSKNVNWALSDALAGRLLCDTYLSSQELLKETTYTLSNLAATQLHTTRVEIEPVDLPAYFATGAGVVDVARSTQWDARLVQKLMFKLQVLPLTKQLTCIAGNLWSQTLKSNRAVRTEYLLLHEFHRIKFLPPEKASKKSRAEGGTSNKAKFSGGLVLEPKKGLYDSFILLLDFNSLYPSLIQEYNLCFTTMNWAPYQQAEEDDLPDLPDPSAERGVLPRVIQSLVERRRAVKKILKAEKNEDKKKELDIRQQALKLTANSMYGCLGFSNSRFFAQPIAARVTSLGRETLQNTVNITQDKIGLEVVYGDTDSIMINTRINDESNVRQVRELGERVKKEVNKLYRTLELEIDGVFRSLLLLKKKKYAAKTVEIKDNEIVKYGQELKGLDLVRRDWCVQSRDTGRYITDQILSGKDNEVVVEKIHAHLEEIADKMRKGELPLEKYTITKGISKHPNDYPDDKAQPHVHVAKMMLKAGRHVGLGDHIPYIITAPVETGEKDAKVLSPTDRAVHPDEIARSNGTLKPDIDWYLMQQILPPIARLCDPIEGTSQQMLAERLGLDATKYRNIIRSGNPIDDDITIDYKPTSFKLDEERFKDVSELKLMCASCGVESDFPGVFHVRKDQVDAAPESGLSCTNPSCTSPLFWGQGNHYECYAMISNASSVWVNGLLRGYYDGTVRCDEPGCGLETRQLSVAGANCLRRGCSGRLMQLQTERELHNSLKYLETQFNVDHASSQLEKRKIIPGNLSMNDRATFDELHAHAKYMLDSNSFNWISPSFWKTLFKPGGR